MSHCSTCSKSLSNANKVYSLAGHHFCRPRCRLDYKASQKAIPEAPKLEVNCELCPHCGEKYTTRKKSKPWYQCALGHKWHLDAQEDIAVGWP